MYVHNLTMNIYAIDKHRDMRSISLKKIINTINVLG